MPLFLLGEVDSCYSHFLLLSSFQHSSSHCGKKQQDFWPHLYLHKQKHKCGFYLFVYLLLDTDEAKHFSGILISNCVLQSNKKKNVCTE